MKKTFPPWGMRDIIFVSVVIFLLINIIFWLLGDYIKTFVPAQRLLINTLFQTGSILLVILYFLIFKRARIRDLGFRKGRSVLKVGLLGGLVLFTIVFLTGIFIELLLSIEPQLQPFAQVVIQASNYKELLLLLFIGSFLAPLGEELYFRGLVYPVLKRKWGIKKGMIYTGAFFAILHFDFLRFLPLTLGGVGLAYFYEKTGSIITPMLAHGVWNGIMVVLLYFI